MLLEEGFALVLAELAVVLAGGCIVPLDPTQPPARIAALLTDCQAVLLLASASPARRRLLEQAAIAHRVQMSGVDERAIQHPDPAELVLLLAQAKARAVQRLLDRQSDADISVVLVCDSVLVYGGEVFGKPSHAAEAI